MQVRKRMNPSTGDTKKTKIGSQGPKEDRRYVLRMHHRPRLPTQSNPETYRKKQMHWYTSDDVGKTWYPTGWTLNQETGLWEAPDYMK